MSHNPHISNHAGKCIRCGLCMSVCPVYQVSLEETDVARGKMALLDWEKDQPDAKQLSRFQDAISRCLLCGACSQVCPNQVPTNNCIQQVRQKLPTTTREKLLMKSLSTVSKNGWSGRLFRKSASIFQTLIGKGLPEKSGMHLRFPLTSLTHRKYIPKLSANPFTTRYVLKKTSQLKRILYFTGCGANYFFDNTAHALTTILERNNHYPYVPETQTCCGLPFYAAGDMVHAAALARQNIDTIDKLSPDIILTTCASCGAQIHRWPELLKHEPDYDARARNIANSQKDATSFVLENCYPIERLSSQCSNENILYHHPCHMRWGETKASVPNELFEPFDKIKVNYSDSLCCGNGGKFQISHFDLSMNIFDQRLDLFAKYAINYVLTPCTGCQLQFCEGLLQKGISVPVLHPLAWLYDIGCIE